MSPPDLTAILKRGGAFAPPLNQRRAEMQNTGVFDRIVRFVVGIALMASAYYYSDLPYGYLGWLGIIPLVTSVIGYCPLYSILGVRTDGKLIH
jgi:Protein of unknown function (DUF2892)